MSSDPYLGKWIQTEGDRLYSTIEMMATNPEKVQCALESHPKNEARVMSVEGQIANFIVSPSSTARLASELFPGQEIAIPFCAWALRNLVSNNGGFEVSGGTFGSYAINTDLLKVLLLGKELDAALLGYRYFLPKRSSSIVEIHFEDDQGSATGTGFILEFGPDEDRRRRLVTCRHVVFDKDGAPRENLKFFAEGRELLVTQAQAMSRVDVCILGSVEIDGLTGLISRNAFLLDGVFTAGFPRVMLGLDNPLLYHSGEINGWLGEKEKGGLFAVTSADVAPGNSGGPVFGDLGYVVGVVSDQYLDKRDGQIAKHNLFIPIEQINHDIAAGLVEEPVSIEGDASG